MHWTSSSGLIELNITKKQAANCAHAGDCSLDVEYLSGVPVIRRQLNKISPETLKNELAWFGAWNDEELAIHSDNLQRVLWVACCDIREGNI